MKQGFAVRKTRYERYRANTFWQFRDTHPNKKYVSVLYGRGSLVRFASVSRNLLAFDDWQIHVPWVCKMSAKSHYNNHFYKISLISTREYMSCNILLEKRLWIKIVKVQFYKISSDGHSECAFNINWKQNAKIGALNQSHYLWNKNNAVCICIDRNLIKMK